MNTLRSKTPGVELYWEGHRKRHRKQLGLRGNARNYDANGVCGKQTLVIAADRRSLLEHKDQLFPGHHYIQIDDPNSNTTIGDRIITVLAELAAVKPMPPKIVTTKDIAQRLGCSDPRIITKHFSNQRHLKRAWENLGYKYRSVRGRGGARWEWVGHPVRNHGPSPFDIVEGGYVYEEPTP
jgi:hypothetical protein